MKKENELPEQELPLHEQVFLYMKESLMQGLYKPGQQLTLRSLAEELGTSIAPIREAVSRLSALDALRVFPKRYIQVPVLTAERYFEFIEVRKLLEGHATGRACEKMSDADIKAVTAINKKINEHAKKGQMRQAMKENQKFHFAIYQAAESPVLLESIEHIWLRVGPTIHHILAQEDQPLPKTNFSSHQSLIDALTARNLEAALAAMLNIIDIAADELLAGLRRQSDTSSKTLSILSK